MHALPELFEFRDEKHGRLAVERDTRPANRFNFIDSLNSFEFALQAGRKPEVVADNGLRCRYEQIRFNVSIAQFSMV